MVCDKGLLPNGIINNGVLLGQQHIYRQNEMIPRRIIEALKAEDDDNDLEENIWGDLIIKGYLNLYDEYEKMDG